jgi:hypothetical protein
MAFNIDKSLNKILGKKKKTTNMFNMSKSVRPKIDKSLFNNSFKQPLFANKSLVKVVRPKVGKSLFNNSFKQPSMSNKILGNFGLKQPLTRRQDWDGDGIINKKDCQPRNVMRQDKINQKRNYDIAYLNVVDGDNDILFKTPNERNIWPGDLRASRKVKLINGKYYLIGNDDESVDFDEFDSKEQARLYVNKQLEINDNDLEGMEDYINSSFVDNDSMSQVGLYKYEDKKLKPVVGDNFIEEEHKTDEELQKQLDKDEEEW